MVVLTIGETSWPAHHIYAAKISKKTAFIRLVQTNGMPYHMLFHPMSPKSKNDIISNRKVFHRRWWCNGSASADDAKSVYNKMLHCKKIPILVNFGDASYKWGVKGWTNTAALKSPHWNGNGRLSPCQPSLVELLSCSVPFFLFLSTFCGCFTIHLHFLASFPLAHLASASGIQEFLSFSYCGFPKSMLIHRISYLMFFCPLLHL